MEYIYICIDIYIYWKTVGINILFMFGPIRIAIENWNNVVIFELIEIFTTVIFHHI